MTEIASLLDTEIGVVEDFVGLLEAEQRILQEGDADRLPAQIAEKTALVERLGQLAGERNRQLLAAFGAEDGEGLRHWARAQGAAASDRLDRLLALAAQARELNRVNGKLIALRLNHTQAALASLAAGGPDRVYGRDGQTSTRTGYRLIDSA